MGALRDSDRCVSLIFASSGLKDELGPVGISVRILACREEIEGTRVV